MERNKYVLIFAIILLLVSIKAAYSQTDQFGCCVNPGAGDRSCSSERLVKMNSECCPQPESSFASYYISSENPQGPSNYNDCTSNFFFINKDCGSVDSCSLGCCCSGSGATITPESRCKGLDLTFYKGQTSCSQVCRIPQCNDGIDNDNNGCGDFEGGDTGCTGSSDNTESGGTCINVGGVCSNPSYVPKFTSLEVMPAKGEKRFLLSWTDECSKTASFYEIFKCAGNGCSNFILIGTTNLNSFEDSSPDLLFSQSYNYLVKSHYNLQAAVPAINKTASLGNIECLGIFSPDSFCMEASVYSCDKINRLNNLLKCSSNQVCSVNNNNPICVNRVNCDYKTGNPFGLFYAQAGCENGRYCFYDKSGSTVNSCFGCDPSMSCYDYKSQQACTRDNCRIDGCVWKPLGGEIGTGACVSTKESNCNWCTGKGTPSMGNLIAFNNVFDICTKAKSDALSVDGFKCYFGSGKSNSCQNITCRDYSGSQCRNDNIQHDENNLIINPSNDECALGVCQNIGNQCIKNADGDNQPDCSNYLCEGDYFAPNTNLITLLRQGVLDSISINIYDRTSANNSYILRTSSNYTTYICAEPCGQQGHPYNASTMSRKLIISNLNIYDGDNGNKLLALKSGNNTLRYYSKDPSNNLEQVKRITLEARRDSSGPQVYGINVTGASKISGRFFTRNNKPQITINFVEPAVITFARLVNKNTGFSVQIQPSNEINTVLRLDLNQTLSEGEYTFQLNAKNSNGLFMNALFTAQIIVDSTPPAINVTPSTGSLINSTPVSILIAFNEEVNLAGVKINLADMSGAFSSIDKKLYTASLNLSDGNKVLEASAKDYAGNQISGSSTFIVDAYPTQISLLLPQFGVSSAYNFEVDVQTDNNAQCRYELDNNLEFEFMNIFPSTGGVVHTIPIFNRIANGDTILHKLYVKCRDLRGTSSNAFDIGVDSSQPQIINSFAYPNPIIERPIKTTLTVETNEPTVCKYSANTNDFSSMENKFNEFDNNTFLDISRQQITLDSEGVYSYYVACKNKAQLVSGASQIKFTVNLSASINIISHTAPYFNISTIGLAIETNKLAQCKYSETDSTVQTGFVFGVPSYSHVVQLTMPSGKHDFFISCKDQYLQQWSPPKTISFIVDPTPPIMLFVNDTSTLGFVVDRTCNTDRLRVKFLGDDPESGVKDYFYSIIRDNQPITSLFNTFSSNEWMWVQNLNLQDNSLYFFSVKARNYAELGSLPKISDGITVDTSACRDPAKCGDGIINQLVEECDGISFGAINSCLNYTNFVDGTLKCTTNCKLDTSSCTKLPDCGNSKLDPGETCDGSLFGIIDSCTKYNSSFSGGTPRCSSTCQLDTSSCTEKPKCGNTVIDTGESCDGINLGPLTGKCIDYNPSTFTDGNITCSSCRLDTLKCAGVSGACQNGIVNIGETCDGTNFGQIKSCTDITTFSGGTLKCASNCQLDTSSCTEKPKCGNSAIDLGESCDTNNLGPLTGNCIDYSPDFNAGTLKCTACKLDTGSCSRAPTCGNSRLDTGELCDGTRFSISDLSCNSYKSNFNNGTLICGSSCTISTRNCNSNVTIPPPATTCKDNGTCRINDACTDNSDCESRYCASNKKCQAPSCSDGIKNQDESDIDCGGSCIKCPSSKLCRSSNDCQSSYCSFGICSTQDTCLDSKLSPGETDTDCGGPCPRKCLEGSSCEADIDCQSDLKCRSSQCKKLTGGEIQNPAVIDTDGDGMPDDWEVQNGLNPSDANDSNADDDKDGLTNLQEFKLRDTYGKSTDPHIPDTDGDGFNDGDEAEAGTNPLDAKDFPKSSKTKIILFILGAIILISGFGYLGYTAIQKRRESEFEIPKQRETPRNFQTSQPGTVVLPPRQQAQQAFRPQQNNAAEQARIKEALKFKQQRINIERKNLFEPFGGSGPAQQKEQETKNEQKDKTRQKEQETKTETNSLEHDAAKRRRMSKPAAHKVQTQKEKEDAFGKLRQMAKEPRTAKSGKGKHAEK